MENIYLANHFISFRFLLNFIAILVILFLGFATFFITYKTCIDVLAFIYSPAFISSKTAKWLSLIIALLISLATFVQSSPIIWITLSYWGQCLDNMFALYIMKKTYFLKKSIDLLNKARNKLDKANSLFQKLLLTETKNIMVDNPAETKAIFEHILKSHIFPAIKLYKKAARLLKKGKTKDTISMQKKDEAKLLLNRLIAQATEFVSRILMLKKQSF